jgi:hypothetical protein
MILEGRFFAVQKFYFVVSELNFKYLIKLNFSVVEKIIQIRILERILGNSISIIKPCQFLKIYLDFEIKK